MRKPDWESDGVQLYCGDCLDVLPEISGLTAVCTDPPYGLSFMGKDWDRGVPGPHFWEAIAGACVPGAPMLAFGGTRTYHRLVCAIEDAGWEIRDCLMWLYGSGFPKSLDVSKAIDKHGGARVAWFGAWFRKWRQENGIAQKQVAALFPSKTGGLTGCVANWELGFNMPTPDQFNTIRDAFGLPFETIAEAERDVVGRHAGDMGGLGGERLGPGGGDITAPATDAAKLWDGWGTALKPAHEPICLAMKPPEGTYAQNALTHGVAGLNVDGGRIATDWAERSESWRCSGHSVKPGDTSMFGTGGTGIHCDPQGRWPANVIHDGSDEVVGLFPASRQAHSGGTAGWQQGDYVGGAPGMPVERTGYDDTGGSAARFFYCAKASKAERNAGCEGLPQRFAPTMGQGIGGKEHNPDTATPKRNTHPTVKPLALMRYLLTLITMPQRNLILDPFMGSGSTGVACVGLGLPFVGIELDRGHFEIACRRIEAVMEGLSAEDRENGQAALFGENHADD